MNGTTITVHDLAAKTPILALKQEIQDLSGVRPCDQVLSFSSKLLQDNKLIGEYGIKSESCIDLNARLKGGAIIKWYAFFDLI